MCALFPADAVNSLLDTRFADATPEPAPTATQFGCAYGLADDSAGDDEITKAMISGRPADSYEVVVSSYEMEPVSGLAGDAAFADKIGLIVKPGGKKFLVQIAVNGSDVVMDKDRCLTLAKAVLDKI